MLCQQLGKEGLRGGNETEVLNGEKKGVEGLDGGRYTG